MTPVSGVEAPVIGRRVLGRGSVLAIERSRPQLVLSFVASELAECVVAVRVALEWLGMAADRTQGFALRALDVGRVRASPPLQLEMLADRVIQEPHAAKAYSAATTLAVAAAARIVRFFPLRLAW